MLSQRGDPAMIGNRDHPATPPRLTKSNNDEKSVELFAISLWSIVGVALIAVLIWLALSA